MVTCVPGHSPCTASASTWAASWRISSRARGSSRERNSSLASASSVSDRSESTPSRIMATVRLARLGEMDFAMSRPDTPGSNGRLLPSGKVTEIMGLGSSGSVADTGRRKLRARSSMGARGGTTR